MSPLRSPVDTLAAVVRACISSFVFIFPRPFPSHQDVLIQFRFIGPFMSVASNSRQDRPCSVAILEDRGPTKAIQVVRTGRGTKYYIIWISSSRAILQSKLPYPFNFRSFVLLFFLFATILIQVSALFLLFKPLVVERKLWEKREQLRLRVERRWSGRDGNEVKRIGRAECARSRPLIPMFHFANILVVTGVRS